MKNIVLLSLAMADRAPDDSVETKIFQNAENYLLAAAHSNEAAIRYLGATIERRGEAIDHMFLFVPSGAETTFPIRDAAGNLSEQTHLGFLKNRLELGFPQLTNECTIVPIDPEPTEEQSFAARGQMKKLLHDYIARANDDVTLHADFCAPPAHRKLLETLWKELMKDDAPKDGYIVEADLKKRTIALL